MYLCSKNITVKYLLISFILASCTSTNLYQGLAEVNQPLSVIKVQALNEYNNFSDESLNLIFESDKTILKDDNDIELIRELKRNYQKIIQKDSFKISLHPNEENSKKIIKLIYELNLPIRIQWSANDKKNFPEDFRTSKVNNFCSSIYEDALSSIINTLNGNDGDTLIIYSTEYEYLLNQFDSLNSDKYLVKLNSKSFQDFASTILEVNQSNDRYRRILNINPNQNLQFNPRTREDISNIIILINPSDYKSIVPSLRYFGENSYNYYNFISALEGIMNPMQLLDYENSYIPMSNQTLNKIRNNKITSMDGYLELAVLNDWLIAEIFKQSGIRSGTISGMTGRLNFSSGSCIKRNITLKKMKPDLIST